jgi:uncharacterized protein
VKYRETPLARETFELPRAPFPPIRGEVRHPEGRDHGTVLLLHGFKGFARWGFFPYVADTLARAGLRAITFDFSGSGIGADRESFTELDAFRDNTWTRELEDAALVRDHARARDWLGARYAVFGHSRGGGIAILHADRDPGVAALATWAAVSTPARWSAEEMARWGERGSLTITNARTGQALPLGLALRDEVEREAAGALNVLAAGSRLTIPWLIAHGSADETVSFAEAERLRDAATQARVQFARIGGASHTMDAAHPLPTPIPARLERVAAITREFLRAHLS